MPFLHEASACGSQLSSARMVKPYSQNATSRQELAIYGYEVIFCVHCWMLWHNVVSRHIAELATVQWQVLGTPVLCSACADGLLWDVDLPD